MTLILIYILLVISVLSFILGNLFSYAIFRYIAIVGGFLGMFLLISQSLGEIKEDSPYNFYPDKFCEHYGYNYEHIVHWSSNEDNCLKIENETLTKRAIAYDGEIWGWKDFNNSYNMGRNIKLNFIKGDEMTSSHRLKSAVSLCQEEDNNEKLNNRKVYKGIIPYFIA